MEWLFVIKCILLTGFWLIYLSLVMVAFGHRKMIKRWLRWLKPRRKNHSQKMEFK